MRPSLLALAVGLLLATAIAARHAQAQGEPDNSRRSMGNLHPDSYTAGRATHGSNAAAQRSAVENARRSMGNLLPDSYTAGQATHGSNRSTRPTNTVIVVPQPYYPGYYYGGYPYYPDGYGYYPYYPRPYYYPGYVYPPPAVLPAETLYGPRTLRRFFGW